MAATTQKDQSMSEILRNAGKRALGGGTAGAVAMVVNVSSLMWMRTTVNYQYRYGLSTGQAFRTLYNDGGRGLSGVLRFYRGYFPALLQGPLSRFGDTAANAGMIALWDSMESTKNLPTSLKTLSASSAAATFRICLMPIDATKTIMQVEGKDGFSKLLAKVRTSGPSVLWHGAIGAATATFVGHYPWFFTYNKLNEILPQYDRKKELAMFLVRNAAIGFCASAVSDTCSNSIRVLKTTKQTSTISISYPEAFRMVVQKDGLSGLFLRGLGTKILSNGCQGLLFSVLWKLGQDIINGKGDAKK
mmetsp:Transcript_29486/g.71747  ORF Transcript_29486/g.71747 Transcript_29486/m.71747 type:complete len:303 (-) Transcript_29486:84-992(-)|eukprot:CAMPEP_0198308242 /NCGR_PEP_ID=MMETSP1450-20131203/954_1 /TAXON_ID=753684 ORGANISM="Madagascaria erythrocladiodes, Strain CCMP3234" /NCGR_SAMPLE_ID=MMETSP1450 /ASSEMBLY_ACC=CAM_ASM_001115 /LENGTH=302 /DNA_ID=CAMNT_0044010887 /DNA_START=134 /DNA_END=1042 /DNA_ORIENTATION=+